MLAPLSRRPAVPVHVLVAAGAILLALVDAALLVKSPGLGVALPVGLAFVGLAIRNVQLATALWIVVIYISGLPGFESFNNRVIYIVAFCWLGTMLTRQAAGRAVFGASRGMILLVAGFITWQVLSVGWAPIPADGQREFKDFFCIALGFLVISSSISAPKHVRWLAIAFVVGAVLSVLGGVVANGGFTSAQDVSDTATSRFTGGGGDPNYLAAMIVPALAFAGGLWFKATAAQRGWLLGAVAILALGMAATQSRGGFLALGATLLAGLIVLRGRRMVVLVMVGAVLAGAVGYFVAYPAAWERVHAVQDNASGSGRTDIWQVAWRVAEDHWVAGVGLAQFPNVSPHYTRQPGDLQYVSNIVEEHIVVHDVYLELFAESGVIGLGLYLLAFALALLSSWKASVLFERDGDADMTALSRATLLAIIGVAAGSVFLSNQLARPIWVLLALGPVLLAIARRQAADAFSDDER